MQLLKLTPDNAKNYVGREILFKTREKHIVKTIDGISESGKTLTIDHPDLNNRLQIVTRDVYVIIT